MSEISHRDPTFEIVAGREAREIRLRARSDERRRVAARMPNTLKWVKRLRIRELVRREMDRNRRKRR